MSTNASFEYSNGYSFWNQKFATRLFFVAVMLGLIYMLCAELADLDQRIEQDQANPIVREIDIVSWKETQLQVSHSDVPEHITQLKNLARDLYWPRRKQIRDTCIWRLEKHKGLLATNSDMGRWRKNLWWDFRDEMMYCGIPKVGSSTWAHHFIALTNEDWKAYLGKLDAEGVPHNMRRQRMKQDFYSLPETMGIDAGTQKLLTFAFVRNPFTRFVSGYYQKMVQSNWTLPQLQNKELKWMRDLIIERYRKVDPATEPTSPTPLEFVQYIIDTAHDQGIEKLESHFKPLWSSCPFCLIDFDVIGQIEDFVTDTNFIIDGLSLLDKLNVTLHANENTRITPKKGKEQAFFSRLPSNKIQRLYGLYKLDFDMFGYPFPHEYLQMGY